MESLRSPQEIQEDLEFVSARNSRMISYFEKCCSSLRLFDPNCSNPLNNEKMRQRFKKQVFRELYQENLKMRMAQEVLGKRIESQGRMIEFLFRKEESLVRKFCCSLGSTACGKGGKEQKGRIRGFVKGYVCREMKKYRKLFLPSLELVRNTIEQTANEMFRKFDVFKDFDSLKAEHLFRILEKHTAGSENYEYLVRKLIFEQHQMNKEDKSVSTEGNLKTGIPKRDKVRYRHAKKVVVNRFAQCFFRKPKVKHKSVQISMSKVLEKQIKKKMDELKEQDKLRSMTSQDRIRREVNVLREKMKMQVHAFKKDFMKQQKFDLKEKNQSIRNLKTKIANTIKLFGISQKKFEMTSKTNDELRRKSFYLQQNLEKEKERSKHIKKQRSSIRKKDKGRNHKVVKRRKSESANSFRYRRTGGSERIERRNTMQHIFKVRIKKKSDKELRKGKNELRPWDGEGGK